MKFVGAHIFSYDATFRSNVNVTGNLDVDGTINIDAADIDGNLQLDGTLTVGVDDTGYDVKFFGATSGRYLLWDESQDRLEFTDDVKATFGTSADYEIYHNGTSSLMRNYTGHLQITNYADDKDIIFQSDDGSGGVTTYFKLDGSLATHDGSSTTTMYTKWEDNSIISLGTSNDIRIYHNGTDSYLDNLTGDYYIRQKANDKDLILQCDDGSGGNTAYITLDGGDTDIKVHKNFEIEKTLTMQHTADPSDPATGHSVMWSDTSGNLKVKINVGGSVVTRTLATGTD